MKNESLGTGTARRRAYGLCRLAAFTALIFWREAPEFVIARRPTADVAISGRHCRPVPTIVKMACTDCVCSGAHCAAVGGFAALRMRRPLYGERAPCEGPFNRARALVHRSTTLTCHSEERSDVGISCRQLRFRRECPAIRPGTARLHPKGTSSRFALRAPRPLWGLAMTIRNPCMFGDAAQQPVTAKGAYSP